MATDRDERLRQQRELEEIRRSFAEMGARMGSMFEPAEPDEAERSRKPLRPPAATSQAPATAPPPPATVIKTRTSVPETCVETAELADEVISRLNRNIRDNRLAEMLRDYTINSQACRRQASP